MQPKLKNALAIALPIQIIMVQWLAQYPDVVETYYSKGLYPYIASFLRILFGWLPFSFGDVLYTLLFLLAGRYIFRKWKSIKGQPWSFVKSILAALSMVYFAFHMLWGMNYYRQPITWKLGIDREYTEAELMEFTQYLIAQSNQLQMELTGDSISPVHIPYSRSEIFNRTVQAYEQLQKTYPDFAYAHPSLKSSLYSFPLTVMGYGGYLNPFTNEAQVNGLTPLFRMPVVSGHEVGHQLGYSAEDATNFIGHLVTLESEDPYFKYAAYHHALGYCLNDLFNKNESRYTEILPTINKGVKANFKELQDFWKKYENPLEPVFKSVFNTFLKVNNQKEGIKSYNSVVGLMINHRKQQIGNKPNL